ncbi:MAG: GIY-YIG nuclease family protein [Cyanobacteria bacterium TGS_CYA1]|nr:GIY-YIG nuclease family protein [Cyanobacteria bacterium TGS_CYA1]MDX2105846.1 GIY-YIG nuclease family protein [Candidatus Melainabacteria bacterium]
MNNYTYILHCADNTYYTGWTNDIKARLNAHNTGKGAKYTRTRQPVKLVYCQASETRSQAQQLEYRIKQMSRSQKEGLIRAFQSLLD